MLTDTHCHLDFPPFGDPAERRALLDRAGQLGVRRFIVPAVRAASWQGLLEWQAQEPRVQIALGLHPYFVAEHSESDISQLRTLLARHRERVVAVGEAGLDQALSEPDYPRQLQLFEQQLILACEFDLPLILHVRKAHPDALRLLKQYQLPRGGVLHGFSGSFELAQSYIGLGFKLGIGGTITYPRAAKTRRTAARLPADSLLLETDSPDMPLYGYQGQRNSPERLPQVLATLAELRQELHPERLSELARQLEQNCCQLFNLPSEWGHTPR